MDLIENELILKLLEFVELEVCFGFALSESEIRHSQVLNACGSFFTKNDNDNGTSTSCNLCGKSYKFCGNTTNMATHLKTKHHFAYLQLKGKGQKTAKAQSQSGPGEEIGVGDADAATAVDSVDVDLILMNNSISNISTVNVSITNKEQTMNRIDLFCVYFLLYFFHIFSLLCHPHQHPVVVQK